MFKKTRLMPLVLYFTLIIQCMGLAFWPSTADASTIGTTPFDYAVFSNNNINISGNNSRIEGSTHANAAFNASGNNLVLTETCEAVSGINISGKNANIGRRVNNSGVISINLLPDYIQAQLQNIDKTYIGDTTFTSTNFSLNNSIYVDGKATFSANNISGKGTLRAKNDIVINGNNTYINSNTDEICFYSETGNIYINANNANIVGTLYAPNGTVYIQKNNAVIRGRIIANQVDVSKNNLKVIYHQAIEISDDSIRILEVQPGMAFDIDSAMLVSLEGYFRRKIELEQMPMPLFISKIEEINGHYDIVYIGNNKTYGDSYSKIGAKVWNRPNYSASLAYGVEYYSGNDITNLRASKLKSFIESKQLTMFDSSIFTDLGLLSTKLANNFKSYATNSSNYPNVKTGIKSGLLNSIKTYTDESINVRPTLEVKSSPLQYDGTNAIANGGLMGFTLDLYNNNGNSPMTVKLYLDMNGDGIYQDSEVVGQYNNVASTDDYTINYSLPINYSGLAPWKLEVADSFGAKAYETGFAAYKGSELSIRVLQLLPANSDGSATFKLSSLANVNGQNMLVRAGEYKISVTEMKINDFNNNYGSNVGGKPTTLNGNYDMVVVGFDDSYVGDLDNSKGALNALTDFADSGQSIMFTHDTIGFSTSKTSNMKNMVNVTNAFRDRLGLNAFATDRTMPETGRPSAGMTRLALLNANWGTFGRFPDTVLTRKINESNITRYPYVLGDIKVSPTHLQYLRLDAEDPEINVAYTYKNEYIYNHGYRTATLKTPVKPETLYRDYDGFNDYYTYSKGNLTFSGTGHSVINSVSEMQMFINTIYKASIGSNHAPTVEINGLTEGQNIPPSQSSVRFSFVASDVDWVDKNLDVNIYIDRNNNDKADAVELVKFKTNDTVTFKNLTNGTAQIVELTKDQLGLAESVQQFGIILEATDKRGAKGSELVKLNHKNQPTLSITADPKGYLIGDSGPISFSFNPVATGISNEFKNMKMTVDFTALIKDMSVSGTTGWIKSGNKYTTNLPDLVFGSTAVWAGDSNRSLNITVLKNDERLTGDYALDVPVTINYDRYDPVTNTTKAETSTASIQVRVVNGTLNIFANDNTGKGINNAQVSITGAVAATGITQSGALRVRGLKSGTYTVKLTIPQYYINAGSVLTKTIAIGYDSYSGGTVPSVTFGVTQKVPESPGNLVAAGGVGIVNLTWSQPSGADSSYTYTVKRSTTPGGPYIAMAENIVQTSYTDTGLTNGTKYYYVVSAVNKIIGAQGPDSNEASATPLQKPLSPTNVAAAAGESSIVISWNEVEGAVSYDVKRATVAGGPYELAGTVVGTTSLTDTGLTNGTRYYYVVTSKNANGTESDNSAEVSAVPKALLNSPTGLRATYINGKVMLVWNPVDTATSYIVMRSLESGGSYSKIAEGITNTGFDDSDIIPGRTYYYVIVAAKGMEQSGKSGEIRIEVLAGNGKAMLPYGELRFGIDTGTYVGDGASSSNISFVPGQFIPFAFTLNVNTDTPIRNTELIIEKGLKSGRGGSHIDFLLELRRSGGVIDSSNVIITKNGERIQNFSLSEANGNIVIRLGDGVTVSNNDNLRIMCIARVSSTGRVLDTGVKRHLAENGNDYLAVFKMNSTQSGTVVPSNDLLIDIRIKDSSIIQ